VDFLYSFFTMRGTKGYGERKTFYTDGFLYPLLNKCRLIGGWKLISFGQ